MSENRQHTINRPDDRRQQTGTRLLFNRETQAEALFLAQLSQRLGPERCRQLRLLGEEMQSHDAIEALTTDLANPEKGAR